MKEVAVQVNGVLRGVHFKLRLTFVGAKRQANLLNRLVFWNPVFLHKLRACKTSQETSQKKKQRQFFEHRNKVRGRPKKVG